MTKTLDFFSGKWVPVFSSGNHTSSSGYTREWTKSDLETIVSKYNPKVNEAPAVVGHPKDNNPAYGWVEELKTDGKFLYAKFKQLVPEFIEAVKSGRFKKRSISLYPDLTLRHIGFLGAVPPAVKGLADIKFNEDDDVQEIEFEEKEGDDQMTTELKKQIEDLQKQLKDNETSFNEKLAASKKEVDALKANVADKDSKISEKETAFNEVQTKLDEANEELKEIKKSKEEPELTEKEKEYKERIEALEIENSLQKKQTRVSDFKAFVDKLHNEGRVVTDFKSTLVDVLEAIHDKGEFDFSDGKSDVLAKVKDYLEKQPVLASFTEVRTPEKRKEHESADAGEKLDKLAKDYLESHKDENLSYAEAISIVQADNIDLASKVKI